MKLLASFSGGKDSMLSVDRIIDQGHEITGLITTCREGASWFHDLPLDLLQSMAELLDLPFYPIQTGSGEAYTRDYIQSLKSLAQKTSAEGIVFGDIDLADHRKWCESLAEAAGLEAVFPLWGEGRKALVEEFLQKGYKTVIKKIDKKKLGKELLGRVLDKEILDDIEELGFDPCGENGEYHTLVVDGPKFRASLPVKLGRISENEWTYAVELFKAE